MILEQLNLEFVDLYLNVNLVNKDARLIDILKNYRSLNNIITLINNKKIKSSIY